MMPLRIQYRRLKRKVNVHLFSAKSKVYLGVILKKLHHGPLHSLVAAIMLEIVEHHWVLKLEDKAKL
jgi:hypothetical protein